MRASGTMLIPGSLRKRADRAWNSGPNLRRTSSANSVAMMAVASMAMPLVITSRSPARAPPLGFTRSSLATPTMAPATTS